MRVISLHHRRLITLSFKGERGTNRKTWLGSPLEYLGGDVAFGHKRDGALRVCGVIRLLRGEIWGVCIVPKAILISVNLLSIFGH